MRLKAAMEGSLAEYMEREYQNCARAVTKGVSLAANGLKSAMRTQVKSAGLGARLANTWRGDVYPKAKNSVSAAGVVYTKAQKIMEGFEYQTVIRGKDGLWMAIPTTAIPKRIRNKRMTPALYEKSKGVRLRFVYRKNGASFLVHEQKRKTIVAFTLVPQVRMPKLINFAAEGAKWQVKLPSLILENWREQT
nr:MAG TPA: hypothetical protein [Caudoviricetes sp.]